MAGENKCYLAYNNKDELVFYMHPGFKRAAATFMKKRDFFTIARRTVLSVFFLFIGGLVCAQTNIQVASPDSLAELIKDRTRFQEAILIGSPEKLSAARSCVSASVLFSDDEKLALLEILRGIESLVYPAAPAETAVKAPPTLNQKSRETSSLFYPSPNLKNLSSANSLILTQLVEASQGKLFSAPKGVEASLASQLLPALAIFATNDRGIAQSAYDLTLQYLKANTTDSALTLLVQARYFMLNGETLKAYFVSKECLDRFPDAWPARLNLGYLSLLLNQPVNAGNFLQPLANSRSSDPEFAGNYGLALYHGAQLSEAESYLKKGLDSMPAHTDWLAAYTHILMDRNAYAQAAPLLETLGKSNPAGRMYLLLKSQYAQAVGRKDEALKTARKALQLYPADPEIMIQLASLLFAGPEEGHQEAVGLCTEALRQLSAPPIQNEQVSGGLAYSPLQKLLRKQAETTANRFLLQEAFNHQEWYRAATLLDSVDSAKLDKAMVATILRKSGKIPEAVKFASSWFGENPSSENAAEAYLRSLAAASTGSGVASVSGSAMPDTGLGLLLSAGLNGSTGSQSSPNPLIGLVLSMLSGSTSTQMRSYLLYLKGTLQTDANAAIESYRAALLEKADNVEAMLALAKTYAALGDKPKALYYVRQAVMTGIQDADLALEAKALEASLSS